MHLNRLLVALTMSVVFKSCSSLFGGFPVERCDDMDPTKIPLEPPPQEDSVSDANATSEFGSEEPFPTSLQVSSRLNLFRLSTSSAQYRRGRVMDITIRGPDFNAFMLQVRKIGPDERRGYDQPVRVGEFTSWPSSFKPVQCDKGKVTALTNKDYTTKSDVTVKWKAPNEDVGDIHVVGRFVYGDEYWQISEGKEMPLNMFPVNLANCGKAKSCILYSEATKSCHQDNCDYILAYSVVNSTNVEFVLGGKAKGEQNYLGVGFSKTKEAEILKLIACTRAKTIAEIKYFVVKSTEEEGIMEHPMALENRKMDLDGDRLWCSFTMPMVNQPEDPNGLDLSVPMYHAYLRGTTNNTKMANIPILPTKLVMSKKEISIEKIKLHYHTMEKPKGAGTTRISSDGIMTAFFLFLVLSELRCIH